MPYPAALGQRPLEVHEAYAALEQFAADYGRDPLLLLMHAAVPETLRPDLLNLIRVNFLAAHGPDPSLEADVLFSPLSTALGGGYYRIDPQVRWHCLVMLRSLHRHAPRPRIRRIAELLWRYVEAREHQASRVADPQMAEFLDIQRWVALAFLEPASAAHAFADALRQVGTTGSTVALRLGGLASAIEVPLAGQPELLAYARGLDALAGGNEEEAVRLLGALGSDEIRVGDIVLKAPGAVLAAYKRAPPATADGEGTDTAPEEVRRHRNVLIRASGRERNPTSGEWLDMDEHFGVINPGDCRHLDASALSEAAWPDALSDILAADTVICDPGMGAPDMLYLIGIALGLRHGAVIPVAAAGFQSAACARWLDVFSTYPVGGDRVPQIAEDEFAAQWAARLAETPGITLHGPTLSNEGDQASSASPDISNACLVIEGRQLDKGWAMATMSSFFPPSARDEAIRQAIESAGMEKLTDRVPADKSTSLLVEELSKAPVAIVDITGGEHDTLIQLGLRQALRPRRTLILQGDPPSTSAAPPFTPQTSLHVIRYTGTQDSLDTQAAARLSEAITQWLNAIRNQPTVDSPVYLALPQLQPPRWLAAEPAPERPTEGEVQTSTAVWALTIRQRGDSALQFMLLIDGQRIDATVHFQRTLVDPLLRQLVSDTRLQRDTLQTLIHLLLPREFAALPAAGRYHLTLGPDTALLPWEQLFHNPADPFAHLFPPRVIRRLDGLRPPSLRRQPESLNALLIGNPQTAGTLPDQESGLPDLPGAQREVVGVMSALNAAGFTTSVGTDENASAVMSRIFARDYRILLISGNAVHEYPRPDGSKVTGFVLSDGVFLTALELQQMRTMPEVVFLNGCHAGRPVADSSDGPPRDMVLALLKAGVQVVVAPGWAVDDLGAATFSESFFTALASGSRFEDAVDTARQASAAAAPDLNTWAAYQAWGDPDYRLLPAPGSAA